MDDLKALAKLINDSVNKIEEVCIAQNLPLPSLSDPFPLKEEIRSNSIVAAAVNNIVAATDHINAIVRPAPATLLDRALGFHVASSMRVAVVTNVAEILREAGPSGLHADEIAKKANVDSNKLARILRILASHHIFKELTPDVFTNNRISSVLDSGKSSAELFKHPEQKHVGTPGVTALIGHTLHQVFPASAFMTETLLDPKTAFTFDANKSPFTRAFNTDLDLFGWLEKPGNEAALTEFGIAMEGTKTLHPTLVVDGFDWNSLPEGSKVVDVGGGVGAQSLLISNSNPRLKLVVQDREATIGEAKAFWNEKKPSAVESGSVTFQVSDFFVEQQVKDADVFFIRAVLHDWSDSYCHTILTRLRDAATPKTQLVVADLLVTNACVDNSPAANIPGAAISPPPPAPLLPNYGAANVTNAIDLQMLVLMNGQERTLGHVRNMFEKAGWSLVSVYRSPVLSATGLMVAKPI